jgi:Uncharacterized conserved protein (DUF2358)
MPVKGLRKYLNSASQLFDRGSSRADIISVRSDIYQRTIQVTWRLEGVLNLPWHPRIKPYTGQTTYYLDADGLIFRHVEAWDITAVDAFISTLLPGLQYGAPPAKPIEVVVPSDHTGIEAIRGDD